MDELYILPFDHRGSFMKIVGAASPPTKDDVKKAKDFKKIIYEAFELSIKHGVAKSKAGILVDEWLGKEIIDDANKKGYISATPLEKSGQDEFDFDREDWHKQIEELNPTFVKVLVRYNPDGDVAINARQAARLSSLSKHLKPLKYKFLFELLVPPLDEQIKSAGSKEKYDSHLRPQLMASAIEELQNAGVDPDIWKLEGLDTVAGMQLVAHKVTSYNPESKIIILGRGESAEKAEHWLKTGAKVSAACGFAVGRTIFKEPLEEHAAGSLSREKAVEKISANYSSFVHVWKNARK